MNPHTGQTTPVRLTTADFLDVAERERAAAEVGLDDPDDLLLIEGNEDHVKRLSDAVAAKAKAERRAANKRLASPESATADRMQAPAPPTNQDSGTGTYSKGSIAMIDAKEREEINLLLSMIDASRDVPDDPAAWDPGNDVAYARAYGLASYRLSNIQLAADRLRKVMDREVAA